MRFSTGQFWLGMAMIAVAGSAAGQTPGLTTSQDDAALMRTHLHQTYPSLLYVERYRLAFPAETQGTDALWAGDTMPALANRADLVTALAALEDQHVAIVGAKAGASETLGVLFRTSGDNAMIVWRVFDPAITAIKPGDIILAINGTPTAAWLQSASAVTFGGNRRSRAAEAALNLGLGTRVVHETAGIASSLTLSVKSGDEAPRDVTLAYHAVDDDSAAAMTRAVNSPDLPRTFTVAGTRVGSLRLGAFAPQYDDAFNAASDAAAAVPGTSDDKAMVAGFCAVVTAFIGQANDLASQSDVIVLDLRGNMGGFGREARLLAQALAAAPLPASFDVFAGSMPGKVTLKPEPEDASCGHMATQRPVIVLTDAGTRSAGELMSAWLWGAGAAVGGERTVGAGGGFEFGSAGFDLPALGYAVRTSGNFTLFDTTGTLAAGDTDEKAMVEGVAADGFAPSRTRPFAIQAAGLRPDIADSTTLADLRDGGVAEVGRIITALKAQGKIP